MADELKSAGAKTREEELIDELKSIADLAHAGGLMGLNESDTLIVIRKMTLPYWSSEATSDKIKDTIDALTSKGVL